MTAYTLSGTCASRRDRWTRSVVELWTRDIPVSPTYELVLKVSRGGSPLYTEVDPDD